MVTLNCKSIIDINHFSYYHKHTKAFLFYCFQRRKSKFSNPRFIIHTIVNQMFSEFTPSTESLLRIWIVHLLTCINNQCNAKKNLFARKKQRKFYIWYANQTDLVNVFLTNTYWDNIMILGVKMLIVGIQRLL